MKNSYEAPQLTVVHFRTEAGFALSTVPACQGCTFGEMTIETLNQFAQEQAFVGQNGTGQNTGTAGNSLGGFSGEDITGSFERWL